ncbi:hypothetical protein GHK68_24340 [Sinorhizobium meliloti]|uniref:hypothetical protein n=1 Tax=Rhizobium meliloti TaxID=382 RepID=UPI001294C149|nr:hypothetical protein [Sinorhizobium meliloti]MQW45303.1 hypothetical protein [Sinorhizobium meliloti]
MGRKIEIELTARQEADAARVFAAKVDPAEALGGWNNEKDFWSDVITNGIDVISALQHPIENTGPEATKRGKNDIDDDLPF